jgi:hypothetical protein
MQALVRPDSAYLQIFLSPTAPREVRNFAQIPRASDEIGPKKQLFGPICGSLRASAATAAAGAQAPH